jgi:hypothetical protein
MENESEKNYNQIVLFKTVTHKILNMFEKNKISDYFRRGK